MLQTTTMPSSPEDDEPRPIDETQPLPKIASPVHIGAAAMLMGMLASQEIFKLNIDDAANWEDFRLGILATAHALNHMYPDCEPELPFSW